MNRRVSEQERVVPSVDGLLTAEDLQGIVDRYASEIQDAIRGRLEKLRDAYEERLRKRGEEWRREADALLDRLSKAEAMVEELRARIEALREEGEAEMAVAPAARPASSPEGASANLADALRSRGFEVIDKRASGGSLWVLGPPAQLKPVITEWQRQGVKFEFAPKGGRATGGRQAWFTKAGSKVSEKTP